MTAIEKAGLRAYTALSEQGKRTSLFTIEDFLCDADRDHYTCPAGEVLSSQGHDRRGVYVRYAVRTSACEECPPKSKCTNSQKARWVSRGLEEEYNYRNGNIGLDDVAGWVSLTLTHSEDHRIEDLEARAERLGLEANPETVEEIREGPAESWRVVEERGV